MEEEGSIIQKKELEIINETGLHARPASVFVDTAKKFESDITIIHNEEEVNAKSIMKVISKGIEAGSKITLKTEGNDEKEAMEKLTILINEELPEKEEEG